MNIERAWEVFMNYLNIMKNYPLYFEKAYIPTKLKLTFEQQVKKQITKTFDIAHCQFYANNLHHTAPQGKTGYFYYFFKKFRENARNCILLK